MTLLDQLIEYCKQGDLVGIKYIVSLGADIRANDDNAVRCASRNGHLQVVKYLVSIGADIRAGNDFSVRYAIEYSHLQIVKYLHEQGADIRAKNDCAVRYACWYGRLEVVKYLVSIGANVDEIRDEHKPEIFGGKIRDFYRRQRDRKKILNIWREIVPLYYHPDAKG